MKKDNLTQMTGRDLIEYIVSHRGQPEAQKARQVYIKRMAEIAKKKDISLYQPPASTAVKIGHS